MPPKHFSEGENLDQVVRLVLAASDTSVTKGESTLKGGREQKTG